jgi:hemolysin III
MINSNLIKPSLRGVIHAIAFFTTLLWSVAFVFSSAFYKFDLPICIFLISQLLQFGVSSCYHIFNWSPKTKHFLRVCDHICIFFLISGTQTSVMLTVIPNDKIKEGLKFIKLSWSISVIGILRLIFIGKLHDILDLFCYIIHGCIPLPFFNLLNNFTFSDLFYISSGGIFYILGGIVYGMERPNFFPKSFGFHELFHVFTILANFFFSIVISKKYISDVTKMIFK